MIDAGGAVPWPIRAILFDKDGTLIDYRATWQAANRAAALDLAAAAGLEQAFADELLRRQGYEPATGEFAADSPLLWATNAEIAARWTLSPELEGVHDVHERVERCFADQAAFPPVPVTELAPLFDRLAARGLLLGVATMDGTAAAEASLVRLAVRDRIAFLAGADSGYGLKPEPGMVLGFCAALKLAPSEVLVVGDHPADLAMARAAGAGFAVAVLTGGCPPAALRGQADLVLPSIAELEAGLDRWSGWGERRPGTPSVER
ncbi:MAG TPA: HAD-IA family hydrolase [Geminicoccaceae bacterium]|jgi:phosphoglycolate phosphatase|nr:HAD-IA family hydrolase [Geminicoccaceae bacterium]